MLNCRDMCRETAPGDAVDNRGCTLPPAPRQVPAGPLETEEPGAAKRVPLTGQYRGGPCGAVCLIRLAFLLAGLSVLRAGPGRR